jgi:signal transduction histidine kinase
MEKGAFEAVLRQTIARLEETNHRKDDFFAVLAHEMRTPLHATLTWIEVLRGAGELRLTVRSSAGNRSPSVKTPRQSSRKLPGVEVKDLFTFY